MLNNIKLIIFDIDGTLLNSVAFNTYNMNQTLEEMGYSYRVNETQIRSHLGEKAEDFYKNVLDEVCYKNWRTIRATNRAHVEEAMKNYGKAFDGVLETFKTLYEKGYTLVLYSNCSRLYLESALKVLGIKDFIDYAECVKDNGLEKPNLIKKILQMYKGYEAVIVGDRIHDMEAASINELPYIAALYGYGEEEIKGAKYQIENIGQLIDLLKEK